MREIDYTQPLSEEDEAYLRERLSNEQVDHMKAKAAGEQFTGQSTMLADPDGALVHAEGARQDAVSVAPASAPGEPKVMQGGDDPADYTVDQVNAYLEKLDPDEDEYARVIDLETAGEARKGILG